MTTKKITLEFTFEEVQNEYDPEYTTLELVLIERTRSDLSPGELDYLGNRVAQSNDWQVDRWIDIQNALASPNNPSVRVDR